MPKTLRIQWKVWLCWFIFFPSVLLYWSSHQAPVLPSLTQKCQLSRRPWTQTRLRTHLKVLTVQLESAWHLSWTALNPVYHHLLSLEINNTKHFFRKKPEATGFGLLLGKDMLQLCWWVAMAFSFPLAFQTRHKAIRTPAPGAAQEIKIFILPIEK